MTGRVTNARPKTFSGRMRRAVPFTPGATVRPDERIVIGLFTAAKAVLQSLFKAGRAGLFTFTTAKVLIMFHSSSFVAPECRICALFWGRCVGIGVESGGGVSCKYVMHR